MFSKFFIERPIFANVIAIVTIVFGLVTLARLPVEQYPQITPPTVQVTTNYPGANAEVVANTVAAPIEQQVNGVEGMLYMSSTSASDGSYALTVTFEVGANIDMSQVLVQNRVTIAQPQLPDEVKRQGVTTKKVSSNIILFVVLRSADPRMDSLYLANYATINVVDELSRLKGVGDVKVIGSSNYSMRVWLDPEKLKARGLTVLDVITSIQEQNVQVAAGQLGQSPAPRGQTFQLTISTLGRLKDVEQFKDIIVKAASGTPAAEAAAAPGAATTARLTRVKDLVRDKHVVQDPDGGSHTEEGVELGGQTYDQFFMQNGQPASGIAVFQLPGANALDVAKEVRKTMERLKGRFPQGLEYAIPFDTTKFVSASIHEVYLTLFEAGGLVLIVIMVFLQDWRAVLVPATTVPVTIIGAFAAMWLFGFSVNMLTLFGLVLAIGIVVDDAIVIVENAAHHIEKDRVSPKEATIRAMAELLGPVIGITLVLSAVFLPTIFLGGVTGQMYVQFALTIAATAVISAINALTLKPAQCASYLRPHRPGERKLAFFRAFNWAYERCEHAYTWVLRFFVRQAYAVMALFVGLAALTGWGFVSLPTGFLPEEDQGYVIVSAQLPDAASQERTAAVIDRINAILAKTPGVSDYTAIAGNNVIDGTVSSNYATFYVVFKDWEERRTAEESQAGILQHLRGEFAQVQEAVVFAFVPPAIRGLGTTGGFQMQVQDRGGAGLRELGQVTRDMVAAGRAQSQLAGLNTTFSDNVPQLFLNIDRTKVKSLGIPLNNVFTTLQGYLGAFYVNDFNLFDRTYQVRIQADPKFRAGVKDISRLEVRNAAGQMVPLGTLMTVEEVVGPQVITRYNMYPSSAIIGSAAPGVSSGQALALMEQMAKETLPNSMGFEWTGMSFQEKQVGGQAIWVFALAVGLVYLVLCAQYESWSTPAAVILVVPLALLGTVAMVALRRMDNNVYTQIGIVLIIALASKNAILIVEFARELRAHGRTIVEAAVEAGRARFRPILMTSFAFILGVFPLVIAKGAGAASRQALGTAVFGGMITSTVLAVFFVPVFYVLIQRLSEWWSPPKKEEQPAPPAPPPPDGDTKPQAIQTQPS
ncbi:MAG TPA: efflux RND transporter permease subunit [Gemmataceae bacterium]|jgi:HAE1 family hydrophobic/amphiphilic exporter-1|nr:efflux RND transporter permease subunit [Gemmataceae bacterium]